MSRGWGNRRIDEKGCLESLGKLGPPSSLMLIGPEVLLRDALLLEVQRAVLGKQEEGRWQREVYSSRETALSVIAAGLRNMGLFAETRCVIVHEVDRYGRCSKSDAELSWQCSPKRYLQ